MTPRENFFAIYNREQPDAYIDAMSALEILPDPILMGDMVPQDGEEHPVSWGVTYCFKPGAPGQHPVINDSNIDVIIIIEVVINKTAKYLFINLLNSTTLTPGTVM